VRWLVDIDGFEAAGEITAAQAELMRARAREEALALGINSVLGAGIVAVVVGVIAYFSDPAATAATGTALAVAGLVALRRADQRIRLPAMAASIVGLATALGGAVAWIADETGGPEPAIWVGLAAMGAGAIGALRLDPPFRGIAHWLVAMGAAVHLAGIFGTEAEPDLGRIAIAYAALVLLGVGLFTDVRLLSALSVVALAGTLSYTGYGGASYFLAIEEPSLLILMLAPVALVAAALGRRPPERWARHARIVGLLAFVWINMAFWIGSLWGDDIGRSLTATEDSPTGMPWAAIGDGAFVIAWAALILAAGGWAALTGRRSAFNAAATFGVIHFYTQWFERLSDDPLAIIGAGVAAIAAAWGIYHANGWIAARRAGKAGAGGG